MLRELLGLGEALPAHRALFRVFDHLIQHVADRRPLSRMVLIYVNLNFIICFCSEIEAQQIGNFTRRSKNKAY